MKQYVSLKARILLAFGSLLLILMLVISLSILFQWREQIIHERIKNNEAIAQSFSYSVLDALIYQANNLQNTEGYLQSYISNYAARNPNIRYVAVWNVNGKLMAHSDISVFSGATNYPKPLLLNETPVLTQIFKHKKFGWITETDYKLQTGNKIWGTLQIAFDSSETRNSIRELFILLLGMTTLSSVLLLLLLYFFANRLTASLSALTKNMDQFDLQKSDPQPIPEVADETAYLWHHFERLKERLHFSQQNLITAQKQIYQAEKLASVGRLASGVAHEINNPLNGIKNCLYILQKQMNDEQQREKYFKLIDEGLTSIESIIRKLLNFSRKSRAEFVAIDLKKEVAFVISLLEYRINEKHAKVHIQSDKNLPAVEADSQLIQEVLMNLFINALDAIDNEGQIKIELKRLANEKVKICIEDNGPGISQEHLNMIFEPFFTTKDEGKGTGLGLSVSLAIIEAHNGSLEVESKPGSTRFIITLPERRKNENSAD